MEFDKAIGMIFSVIGGLGIFLLGMKYMSEGLQTIAGNRLRALISAVTNNRLVATIVGVVVTCVIQSSSVTTVMVVGFVNAGFMTLAQAIGVIMGANIGTTITGWILVLKIGKYGLPLLGVSALFFRFSKKETLRYLAMVAMGVGMVFFGLELMKNGFKPIRQMEDFAKWFQMFQADTYFGVLKCALVGCVLTMIVQSSSATLGITIGLAMTGTIPFPTAAALVLGENIGTTITAWLASIGATTNAKRAAYAHIVFNLIGVLWITALFPHYIKLIEGFMGNPSEVDAEGNYIRITAAIAAVHTGFNVTNTLIFLPFSRKLGDLLMKVVPDKAYKEAPHLTSLEGHMIQTPVIAIEQSRIEIIRMGGVVSKMLSRCKLILEQDPPEDKSVRKLFHKEEVCDIMQKEVTIFLTDMLQSTVTHDVAEEGRGLLRMADEYESVSDYVANVVKLHLRLAQSDNKLPDKENQAIIGLHEKVSAYVRMVNEAIENRHRDIVSKAHSQGDEITHDIRQLRDEHLQEVAQTQSPAIVTVIFTDILNAYRRVKDHTMNVAEALAGEK